VERPETSLVSVPLENERTRTISIRRLRALPVSAMTSASTWGWLLPAAFCRCGGRCQGQEPARDRNQQRRREHEPHCVLSRQALGIKLSAGEESSLHIVDDDTHALFKHIQFIDHLCRFLIRPLMVRSHSSAIFRQACPRKSSLSWGQRPPFSKHPV